MAVNAPNTQVPARQIRALHDDSTVTVYQAYPEAIASRALEVGTFVPPFKRERMTWIKPSFLWMMYRCGYANKDGQERVLAVDISREGFDRALCRAVISHYDSRQFADQAAWKQALRESPVRVQWDPERDLHHNALPHRSLQLGLSGEAVQQYVEEWITGIRDVTPLAKRVHAAVRDGDESTAVALLPRETAYPIPAAAVENLRAGEPSPTV